MHCLRNSSPSRLLLGAALLATAALCGCKGSKTETPMPVSSTTAPDWSGRVPSVDRQAVEGVTKEQVEHLAQRVGNYCDVMRRLNCRISISVNLSSVHNLTDEDLAKLAFPPEVEMVNLSDSSVGDEGVASLVTLKRLTHLDLWQTKVTSRILVKLREMPSLTYVNLQQTVVPDDQINALTDELAKRAAGAQPESVGQEGDAAAAQAAIEQAAAEVDQYAELVSKFGGRVDLQLDFSHRPVTDAEIQQLQFPTAVRSIDLSYTQVTGNVLEHLREAKGLEKLWLAQTQISDADVPALKEFPHLQEINLANTGVSFQSKMELDRLCAERTAAQRRVR